jgi:hypothetical protein
MNFAPSSPAGGATLPASHPNLGQRNLIPRKSLLGSIFSSIYRQFSMFPRYHQPRYLNWQKN